jgi:OOP family OmpA-OmpF porin
MKTSKIILLNVFSLVTLAIGNIASADEATKDGYVTDSSGNIVRSAYNLCWHSGFWTPAMAIEGCDPVKKAAPIIADATPPAEPAPVVQKKPVFITYTLQAEALFAFDKSELSERGKQRISDEIISKMKEAPQDEVVVITGYTDRIGSKEYNMKLSQRRADAVRAYMVEQGIDGSRIETAARGEADPVVSCDNIKGKNNRKNKALIACLQPNRRIVIDLKGQNPVQQ